MAYWQGMQSLVIGKACRRSNGIGAAAVLALAVGAVLEAVQCGVDAGQNRLSAATVHDKILTARLEE